MRAMRIGAVAALLMATSGITAIAAVHDEFPETGPEAMAYYEADVDHWVDGPVQYVILDPERKVFERLHTRTERERFIRRFWERRDPDLRDRVNPYKVEFYKRVAAANKRYHEYPHGWQSDRGLLHIVLGRPDHERIEQSGFDRIRTWTYYTIGPQGNDRPVGSRYGEIKIYLIEESNRNRAEILGDFGPGVYPQYVRDMLDFVRRAAVDPSLRRTIID